MQRVQSYPLSVCSLSFWIEIKCSKTNKAKHVVRDGFHPSEVFSDAVPVTTALGALITPFETHRQLVDVGFKIEITVVTGWIQSNGIISTHIQVAEFSGNIHRSFQLVTPT